MKKYIFMLLMGMYMMLSCISVYAEENDDTEWFQMVEGENDIVENEIVNPYHLYLNNVLTFISYPGNYDLRLRAEVYCGDTMAEIKTIFFLQKKYDKVWKNVSQGTVTKTNSNYMAKNMYVYDVTPGEYRCVTDTMVTDYIGYSETMDSYSGSIDVN